MAKLDNKKIEEIAVNAVRTAFGCVDNVLPHIEVDDRGICVDGGIDVYRGGKLDKDTFIGTIPVQVKGTTAKPDCSDIQKRKVATQDLRQFESSFDGVLYFIVFINPNKQSVRGVYYKQYLPFDIEKLLTKLKKPSQKTITDSFGELPNKPSELKRLCIEFLGDKDNQKNRRFVKASSVQELEEKGIPIESVRISKTFFPGESSISLSAFSNGAYIYGIAQWGEPYVIDRLNDIVEFSTERNCLIKIGDNQYNARLVAGEDKTSPFVKLGGITVRFGDSATLKYKEVGLFRDRLRDAEIMSCLSKGETLYIDGKRVFGRLRPKNGTKGFPDSIPAAYMKYVCLLNRLKIKADIDPGTLEKQSINALATLVEAFVDMKPVNLNKIEQNAASLDMEIGKSLIKILAVRQPNGRYKLYNPLDTKLKCSISFKGDGDKEHLISSVFILTHKDYRLAMNLDAPSFKESLKRSPIEQATADIACIKLFEMLEAADEGAVCQDDLLSCCKILSEVLYDFEHSDISIINREQVNMRLGAPIDVKTLEKIVARSEDNGIKASAHILLGNTSLAFSCLGEMVPKTRMQFEKWPIYHLIEKRNEPEEAKQIS